jgi:hypothetical protein
MPEAGGTATQSGIYYQNSVTALYLGQMLDGARVGNRVITNVRAEARESVDDTVVTYADGAREFIQSKESLGSSKAWRTLWNDFYDQRHKSIFDPQRDRLVLAIGEYTPRANNLRDVAKRASGSSVDHEWLTSLNAEHRQLVTDVEATLPAGTSTRSVFEVFSRLQVDLQTADEIEEHLIYRRLPESSRDRRELLRILRDRIAGNARFRVSFNASSLLLAIRQEDPEFQLAPAIDFTDLRVAARACGALLRTQKRSFGQTGKHFVRAAVAEIVKSIQSDAASGKLTMLLDDAGRGKTVVMADLLDALEAGDAIVIAIKADLQLAGASDSDDLQRKLQLPESLERTVTELARAGPVYVLVDQIDALSHNLAHDTATLDVVLDNIARLRMNPKVRLVISCRVFDRATDPRLRRLDVAHEFRLVDLTDEEITEVLSFVGITFTDLSPATQVLLKTPLHLDLFAWLKTRGSYPEQASPVALQDLCAALLADVALRVEASAPDTADRERVLMEMTDNMALHQRTTTPLASLRALGSSLDRAVGWLASEGILVSARDTAAFFHQTFFDFLYAKRFVDRGESLVTHLLAGPQGLRQRTELMQILLYARGAAPGTYLDWLAALWKSRDLRKHLRRLLRRVLGGITRASTDETLFVRTLLADPTERAQFFEAMSGNASWIGPLRPTLVSLLEHSDLAVVDEVIRFLASVVERSPADVFTIVEPYLHAGDEWRSRIGGSFIASEVGVILQPPTFSRLRSRRTTFPSATFLDSVRSQ